MFTYSRTLHNLFLNTCSYYLFKQLFFRQYMILLLQVVFPLLKTEISLKFSERKFVNSRPTCNFCNMTLLVVDIALTYQVEPTIQLVLPTSQVQFHHAFKHNRIILCFCLIPLTSLDLVINLAIPCWVLQNL